MELLAPAKDLECLKSAILNGADAVYFGGSDFSARHGANNFDQTAIAQAVGFCRAYGAKLYQAVNVLIDPSQMSVLGKMIEQSALLGVDAFIVADYGAARLISCISKDIEIHASTQMTVGDVRGAEMLSLMGFKRVVLPRELTAKQIKQISDNVDIELEVFVHGALCFSVSGQCLMSYRIGGRSGNKGMCAQPCRLPYSTSDGKGYLLSMSDMSLVSHLDDLKSIGVASLKIEGRLKSIEYVSNVTRIFSRCLKDAKDGNNSNKCNDNDNEQNQLKKAFCRGDRFTDGFFTGNVNKRNMTIPTVNNDNLRSTLKECKGDKRIPIDMTFWADGEQACLCVTCDGESVYKTASLEDTPLLPAARVRQQLSKTASTAFKAERVDAYSAQLRVSTINNMRRTALQELWDMLSENRRKVDIDKWKEPDYLSSLSKEPIHTASVVRVDQLARAYEDGAKIVYVPSELWSYCSSMGRDWDLRLLPYLPLSFREVPIPPCEWVMVSTLGQMKQALDRGCKVICDYTFNVTNGHAALKLAEMGASIITLSPEATDVGVIVRQSPVPLEVIGRGRLTLMTTAVDMGTKSEVSHITDRKGAIYPVVKHKGQLGYRIMDSKDIEQKHQGSVYVRRIYSGD